jgi:hypothetical protein
MPATTLYQLTVRGTPIPDDLEAARALHNETAGADASMAAARALGDLSHNVYTPLDEDGRELLFLDTWTSLEGLGQFFANPQVIESAGLLFKEREGVAWMPADGFGSYALLAPSGRSPAGVGLLRAQLTSVDTAREAFAAQTAATIGPARAAGLLSHHVFLRLPAGPGEPAPLELLGIDHWFDLEGMGRFYADLENLRLLEPAFAAAPQTSVWRPAPGAWREW